MKRKDSASAGLWVALLLLAVPGIAHALCSSDSDCGCAQVCAAFVCVPGCTSDSRCSIGQDCIAGICVGCGGDNQQHCPTGSRCNGTQSAVCDPWKNTQGGFCTNCGGNGQVACDPDNAVPGGLANVCQDWNAPTAGGTCTDCGEPADLTTRAYPGKGSITTNVCFDGNGNGNPSYCLPQYNEIGDVVDPIIGIRCQECGRKNDWECLHGTPCDPGFTRFSLDPVRAQVVAGFVDAGPTPTPPALSAAANAIDYCWDPEPVDFARDPPEAWPIAEDEPGPRTFFQIHGRNGGGYTESPSAQALGTRNWIRYRVDYNASGAAPLPFRIWAWDEAGQPYIALESSQIVQFPSSYDFTLRDVADFLYEALLRLPVKGDVILQGQSMGGFVIKDAFRRFHDQLRFRGHRVAQMIFTSHPHFGIVLDPPQYTPFLCSGLAAKYDATANLKAIAQDCLSGRWMSAWESSGERIDDLEYPQVKWATGTGNCDLANPDSDCLCQADDPPDCVPITIEVPPPFGNTAGFEPAGFPGWAALDGDGLFDTDSGLGIDVWGRFPVSPLVFDLAAAGDCRHVTECGIGALQAIDPGLYTDTPVCGDLDQSGAIDAADYGALRDSLAGVAPLPPAAFSRCSVSGEAASCGILDVVRLARAVANDAGQGPLGPGLAQSCSDALDLERGLVGYWPFEPAAGAVANAAESGAHFDAIANGSPSSEGGIVGAALRFDAAGESLRVDDPIALDALRAYSEFSVQAWIHPTNQVSTHDIVLNKEGEYELARLASGTIAYAIAPDWAWVDTGLAAPMNEWTHVVLVFDALAARAATPNGLALPYRLYDGEVRAYANGVEAAFPFASGGVGDAVPAQNELRIAGRQSNADRFSGLLDEVAVWQRALSADEVALLYAGGAGHALGAPAFDPALLSPTLWLDAADPVSLTVASGEVLAWADKAGNGFDVAAVSSAPDLVAGSLAGLPTLQFNGSTDLMCGTTPLALPSGASIFVVARNRVRKSYQGVFSTRASNNVNASLELYWQVGSSNSGNLVYGANRGLPSAGFMQLNNAGPAANGPFYFARVTVPEPAGQTTLRIDTGSVVSASVLLPTAANPVCVGFGFGATTTGNLLDGNIAEILVFDRALTAGERALLEDHLARKWGL